MGEFPKIDYEMDETWGATSDVEVAEQNSERNVFVPGSVGIRANPAEAIDWPGLPGGIFDFDGPMAIDVVLPGSIVASSRQGGGWWRGKK